MTKGGILSFACTDTRTIFYSTLDKNSRFTTGTGYFGKGTNPVDGQLSLDPHFTRQESGTDLYLLGFKNEEDRY